MSKNLYALALLVRNKADRKIACWVFTSETTETGIEKVKTLSMEICLQKYPESEWTGHQIIGDRVSQAVINRCAGIE